MIAYAFFSQTLSQFSIQRTIEKILMDNHYKTIFGPVRTIVY